jgi:hypothetical protein
MKNYEKSRINSLKNGDLSITIKSYAFIIFIMGGFLCNLRGDAVFPLFPKLPRYALIQLLAAAAFVVFFSGIARGGLGRSAFRP